MQATVSSYSPHFANMTHNNKRHDFGWLYTPMSKVIHQLENGAASMWVILETSRYCVVALSQIKKERKKERAIMCVVSHAPALSM